MYSLTFDDDEIRRRPPNKLLARLTPPLSGAGPIGLALRRLTRLSC